MTVPLRTKRNHLDSIIQALDVSSPRNKTDLYQILRNVAESYPRRGLMVLVSDLLVDRDGLVPRPAAVAEPRARRDGVPRPGRRRVGFPLQRPDAVRGPGTAEQLRCNPRALREGYLAALGAYLEEVRRGCSRHNVDYVPAPHQPAAGRRLGRVSEQPVGNAPQE